MNGSMHTLVRYFQPARRSLAEPAPVPFEPVIQLPAIACDAAGGGWFESSLDLRQGLQLAEAEVDWEEVVRAAAAAAPQGR